MLGHEQLDKNLEYVQSRGKLCLNVNSVLVCEARSKMKLLYLQDFLD